MLMMGVNTSLVYSLLTRYGLYDLYGLNICQAKKEEEKKKKKKKKTLDNVLLYLIISCGTMQKFFYSAINLS